VAADENNFSGTCNIQLSPNHNDLQLRDASKFVFISYIYKVLSMPVQRGISFTLLILLARSLSVFV